MCPYTSAYYHICVLILLWGVVCCAARDPISGTATSVCGLTLLVYEALSYSSYSLSRRIYKRILTYTCPHSNAMCPHTTMHVSSHTTTYVPFMQDTYVVVSCMQDTYVVAFMSFMCILQKICKLILLHVCPLSTTIYLSFFFLLHYYICVLQKRAHFAENLQTNCARRSRGVSGKHQAGTVIYVSSYYYYICVLIVQTYCARWSRGVFRFTTNRYCCALLYMCPHSNAILLYMCPHTHACRYQADVLCYYICVLIVPLH